MNKFDIMTLLYDKNEYKKAESFCIKENKYPELLAYSLYRQNKFSEAAEIYNKLERYAEEGYCYLYGGDKHKADKIWFSKNETSSLLSWAKSLSGYINNKKSGIPTFFQIRNYYETDLDMLINLGFDNYAENLVNSIQYFAYINPELYKLTARVLHNNQYYEFADKFLYTAKEYGEGDTELYVLDARNNIAQNRFFAAIKSLEKALEISDDYMPAKNLLKKLKRCC